MTRKTSKVLMPAGTRPAPPNAGKGRVAGIPNKTTALLKDAILKAADKAGGKAGLVGYLQEQAVKHPGPFMALLGKVLPMQLTGPGGAPIHITIEGADAGLL